MGEVHRTLRLLGRGIGVILIMSAGVARAEDRVLVLPTLSLDRDAGLAATQFQSDLMSAIDGRESLSAELGRSLVGKTRRPKPPRSRRELAEGKKLAEKLRIPQAIERLERGLSMFADAPDSIDDFDLVIEATLLLAEAYFRRGKDDLGRKRLADVARYRAGLELPPERYPPLFLNVWREVRAEELARTRGSLVIEGPAGGRVTLNGRSLGEAPLRITELVPGAHHVVVRRNGLAWARTVALAEGREAKASGGSGGSTDEFTEDMQTGAQAQGRDAAATLVVVSAVASTGNGYQVETFVGAVASGEFQRLDTVELGRSLIGTSLETKSIARRLENLRGGLENTLSGAVPFMGNRAVIAAAPGPMSSVAYQEPARAAVDLEPVPAVDAVRPPDPLNPRSQPYVDLEVRDDSSIVDAWWFWPAVGVLAAGAATATYFAFIRDDSVDGVSLEAVW